MLLGEFGPLFELSQTVMDISPFAHVPRMPGGDFAAAPLLWLTAIAAGLIAVGLVRVPAARRGLSGRRPRRAGRQGAPSGESRVAAPGSRD